MFKVKGLCILIVVMALNLPAFADRGNDAYKHGVRAESQADLDAAFGYYKEAYRLAPNNAKYVAAFAQMRFKAANEHVHHGQVLRNTGALKDALLEFQRAVDIDSTSYMAQQELRVTADMIRRQEKHSAVKIDTSLARMASQVGEPLELQPLSSGPITFKITANTDAVYRAVCKLAGINVIIDSDLRAQKMSIDLNNVTLLQALDMIRLQSKTYWRPVLANTIFVTADSSAKRKDMEQNVMKTFYLQNVSSPSDLQEAAGVVSKILDLNRVQLLQAQDALVVRGTMDQMVLVQKLLTDIDKPKSEVVIDVTVMEVSRNRLRTLGANLPTTASVSYLPGTSSGSGSSGPTVTIGSFGVSVPGGSFTALASDSNSKVLQNPQIRVLNDQKATLRIGDRVPIATGSFASTVGGVSPLVSTQFQYLDVGVNIDITPHIHSNHEVTLKLSLEISSVTGEQNIGGVTQPVIGQRRIEHDTELADGEVNLLGGILEDSETTSLSGYPWLLKMPILKYLFAQENKQRQESEIIFAITPHIVRAPEITDDNLRVVEVGTGNSTELRRRASAAAAPVDEHTTDPANPRPSSPATPPANTPAPGPLSSTTPSQMRSRTKPGV